MNERPEESLEAVIHRELRQLPPRKAPENLMPRVRAALQARARLPWWRRPWTSWPRGMQSLSLALMMTTMMLIGYAAFALWQSSFTAAALTKVDHTFLLFRPLWEAAASVGNAMLLALLSMNQTYFMIGASLILVCYLSCASIGTVFYRVMLRSR